MALRLATVLALAVLASQLSLKFLVAIYERAKADLEAARNSKSENDLVAYWESLNDRLRNLGIKLVPLE